GFLARRQLAHAPAAVGHAGAVARGARGRGAGVRPGVVFGAAHPAPARSGGLAGGRRATRVPGPRAPRARLGLGPGTERAAAAWLGRARGADARAGRTPARARP